MRRKIIYILLLSLILVSGFNNGVRALEEVDLLLDWVPNTNHTGIYVALDKGWFSENGIELNIIEPSGNMSVEKVVGSGRADLGISFQEWVTSARVEGVPIVSLAAVIQHNTSGFASLADKNIDRPRDFTDKSYGGWGMPIEKEILRSLVEGDGGDFSTLEFINIGQGDLLTMLERDQFDLVWIYYGWDGIQAELRGLDLNLVMLNDYQDLVPDYYTPVIISSEDYIAENPEILDRVMAAIVRGYRYAIEKPEKAADILLEYTPESDPELVHKSQKWLASRYQDDAPYWGRQRLEVWQEFGNWMYEQGLLEAEFEAEEAYTNRFLPGSEGE